MSTPKKRCAILISGRGSNMMSLVEAAKRDPDYPADFVAVISNRPDAAGLAWAKARGIAAIAIDHKRFKSREEFEAALQVELEKARAEIVACAGFMRIMTAPFVERWRRRMLNIHPSLLPSFKGLDTHQRALEAGVKIAGCTVHLVTPGMDEGPILAQAAVPVLAGDTPETLAARVLAAEHRIYQQALADFIRSGLGKIIKPDQSINQAEALFSPPLPRSANPAV